MKNEKRVPLFDNLSDDQKTVSIPYYVHEGEMYRVERLNKRWFIAFLIVLAMLFVTNAGWIVYDHQFQDYFVQQDVDTGDGEAVVAGVGDANYGQSQTDSSGSGAEEQQPGSAQNLP